MASLLGLLPLKPKLYLQLVKRATRVEVAGEAMAALELTTAVMVTDASAGLEAVCAVIAATLVVPLRAKLEVTEDVLVAEKDTDAALVVMLKDGVKSSLQVGLEFRGKTPYGFNELGSGVSATNTDFYDKGGQRLSDKATSDSVVKSDVAGL
ncbi:uncharacterized protein BCR38DRAFT_412515 [Pseudomassariella vexata]|uniref:Uncharacterized protein n=1 Tax=Pseudomassariella vexata TaxID=1141098 RepID=A0A1Y2DJT6_9PEZI|nr:uncharacterized protein BCR38DRAFT_412515 [Pseudomassariella vexata]ORY59500.1 hypothetical protein BCR38DRAFT_412515 [Pseudomassariella vexata]